MEPTKPAARKPRVSIPSVIIGTFLLIVLALVATPSYLRARISSNEAEAFLDTRAVISAEQTFAAANCSYFDDIHHLCNGPSCGGIRIPGYLGPDFIDSTIGRRSPYSKSGYERTWSSSGRAQKLEKSFSPSSVLDYCYASSPERSWTGVRSFVGTGTGAVYADASGVPYSCPVPQNRIPFTCLVAGTLVDTPSGPVPIEELEVGDEVWSLDPELHRVRNHVTKTWSYPAESFLRIALAHGTTLQLTATHPIATPHGWRAAGALRAGDTVRDREGYVTIAGIEMVRETVAVYDISVQPDNNFFANGVLAHNKLE